MPLFSEAKLKASKEVVAMMPVVLLCLLLAHTRSEHQGPTDHFIAEVQAGAAGKKIWVPKVEGFDLRVAEDKGKGNCPRLPSATTLLGCIACCLVQAILFALVQAYPDSVVQ